MIAVGVNAGGDSGLSGFTLEASSRKKEKKKSQPVPSIVIAKTCLNFEDDGLLKQEKNRKSSPVKDLGEDFELS